MKQGQRRARRALRDLRHCADADADDDSATDQHFNQRLRGSVDQRPPAALRRACLSFDAVECNDDTGGVHQRGR